MVSLPRWWDGLPPDSVRALQVRLPGKDLNSIAHWATLRPGWNELFAALGDRAEEVLGERFSWLRWIHRT